MAETTKGDVESKENQKQEQELDQIDQYLREVEELRSQASAYRSVTPYYPANSIHEEIKDKIRAVKDTAQMLAEEKSLFEMLSGVDDPTKLFVLYMIYSDMKDKQLWRLYMLRGNDSQQNKMIETLLKRIEDLERKMEEEKRRQELQVLADKLASLERKLEELSQPRRKPEDELKDYIDKKIGELMTIIAKAPKEERSELVEAVSSLKEAIENMKKDELREAINKLSTTVEKIMEKAGASGGDIDRAIELLEKIKNLEEKLFRTNYTTPPTPTTTTHSPLEYEGRAPWWMHPDARSSVKDLINTMFDNIKEALEIAFSYMKGGIPPRVQKQVTEKELEELPKI